jgi:ABC-type glycerol-3-phosphate transport system substrate-binding protein
LVNLLPTAEATAPANAPLVLRVWLPPRFDPASDALMQARLDSFAAAHPGLKLDIRVKEESGATGLLESLRLSSAAAPSALPDLIALPRADLERAALAGIIQPLEESPLQESDLTFSARALAHVQNVNYGFPFALDALVLASAGREPAAGWAEAAREGPLTFNGTDGSFPLALYLAAGGAVTDDHEKPFLEESILTRVLTLFAQETVVSVESNEAVWESLEGERGGFAVGWLTGLKRRGPAGVRVEALPGFDESPATLVDGWVWSAASLDVERQELAVELATWLTMEDFLTEWGKATGYLSPYAADWSPALSVARVFPSAEVVAVIEPLLAQAVKQVLEGTSPEAAARAAAKALK